MNIMSNSKRDKWFFKNVMYVYVYSISQTSVLEIESIVKIVKLNWKTFFTRMQYANNS